MADEPEPEPEPEPEAEAEAEPEAEAEAEAEPEPEAETAATTGHHSCRPNGSCLLLVTSPHCRPPDLRCTGWGAHLAEVH